MYSLDVFPIQSVNTDEIESLPPSAIDYVNRASGNARQERAAAMVGLQKALLTRNIASFRLLVSPNGKPYLENEPPHFSISHSGGLCAVALSDSPVGVDLQSLDFAEKIGDTDKFARRFFAPDEYAEFSKTPSPQKLCELWTRKEALCKLLDRPLSLSLSSLSSYVGAEGVKFVTKLYKQPFPHVITTAEKFLQGDKNGK